jgi:predicted nucleotidyltransferase
MPMPYLRYPLSAVFATASHLAVVRAMQFNQEGMSGREIARQAQVNHQSCANVLRALETMGIVKRLGTGHSQLWHLNWESALVQKSILPLLESEREWTQSMKHDICKAFQNQVDGIILFGSVARGAESFQSDVDILLVTPKVAREALLESVERYSDLFKKRYGLRLSAVLMSLEELKRKIKSGDPLMKNISRDRIDLKPLQNKEIWK